MEWKAGYDIGIDAIDKQHRQLVEMISRLEVAFSTNAENKEMGNTLKFLVDYVNQHFSEEEAFMLNAGFPGYEQHKALHKDLIKEVTTVLLRIKKGESINSKELIAFLTDWLMNHILDEDKKIGEFNAGRKETLFEKEQASPEPAETEVLEKLHKLRTLYEKKLISGSDFKTKKGDYLTKYCSGDIRGKVTTAEHKFSFLATLQKDHLITKEEEREHKTVLLNHMDLESFLGKMPGVEEKLLYLKSIFEDGFITEEAYESHKSKFLMDL